MISPKDVVNRTYDGKVLVAFEYVVKNIDGPNGEAQSLRVWFDKVQMPGQEISEGKVYRVFTIIGNNEVYEQVFEMPKYNMAIEMIVAYGLNTLKLILQSEVSYKSMLDFTIGEVIKDM